SSPGVAKVGDEADDEDVAACPDFAPVDVSAGAAASFVAAISVRAAACGCVTGVGAASAKPNAICINKPQTTPAKALMLYRTSSALPPPRSSEPRGAQYRPRKK